MPARTFAAAFSHPVEADRLLALAAYRAIGLEEKQFIESLRVAFTCLGLNASFAEWQQERLSGIASRISQTTITTRDYHEHI